MIDTLRVEEREVDSDIEELAIRLGRLSLTPARTPSPSLGLFLPYGPHLLLSLTWQFSSSNVFFPFLFQAQRREGLQISVVLLCLPQ